MIEGLRELPGTNIIHWDSDRRMCYVTLQLPNGWAYNVVAGSGVFVQSVAIMQEVMEHRGEWYEFDDEIMRMLGDNNA